jgi:hypothetical protein
MFFDESGPFPDTCRELIRSLRGAAIEHVFVGAVALKVYGGAYSEEKIEVCVREPDIERFRDQFASHVFEPLPGQTTRYTLPARRVQIELLTSGDVAGDRFRQQEIRLPGPSEAEFVEGVPVPSLARLIELKLASWDPADRGDVARLIAANKLDRGFADKLNVLVRPSYVDCGSAEAQRGLTSSR